MIKLFNTLSRRLEGFAPLEDGHVRMYTCGPTVYNFAHIGNYRAYVFEDILRRALGYAGFRVTQVMNLTDVDDKTIRGSREAGKTLLEHTEPYTRAFFEDLRVLNIEPAEHYPAATAHIPEMIGIIERLFETGYAYRSDDGSVYYNVRKFKDYGKLAHLDMGGLKAGARVSHDEYEKENVADFALWKAWSEEDGEVSWDSPWGRGRPGWHIECSAMSMKYLGESFDIHTGGVDNMFPHHENEIAQSEGATGKPFVRYWLHCAHLMVEGQKMAKSLDNFYTLRDVLDRGHSGREIRYVLIGGHYRQPLNFTFDAVKAARASIGRLDEFAARLAEAGGGAEAPGDDGALPPWGRRGREAFRSAVEDDLNIPGALGAAFELVLAGNKAMDAGTLDPAGARAVSVVMRDFDRVLGLGSGAAEETGPEVQALLAQRAEARKAKNWAESDRFRNALAQLGWEVRDTPDGQKAKRIR